MTRDYQPLLAPKERPENGVRLDRHYGEIGISALAAALRYQGSRYGEAVSEGAPEPSRARE